MFFSCSVTLFESATLPYLISKRISAWELSLAKKATLQVTIVFHKRKQDSHIVSWGVASYYSNLVPYLHSHWHATRFDPSGGSSFSPVFPFY
jgi:hypothetical protein